MAGVWEVPSDVSDGVGGEQATGGLDVACLKQSKEKKSHVSIMWSRRREFSGSFSGPRLTYVPTAQNDSFIPGLVLRGRNLFQRIGKSTDKFLGIIVDL